MLGNTAGRSLIVAACAAADTATNHNLNLAAAASAFMYTYPQRHRRRVDAACGCCWQACLAPSRLAEVTGGTTQFGKRDHEELMQGDHRQVILVGKRAFCFLLERLGSAVR